MRHADIIVVGGGLAGSATALLLGRAGIDTVLIDPHPDYPPDFRSEKFDASQLKLLDELGLADIVLPAATPIARLWIARYGRVVQKKPNRQVGIAYEALVNTVRRAMPAGVAAVTGKVAAISTSADRQQVTLASGETLSGRLVVLANGLNLSLRRGLGMDREMLQACQSVSIGFDAVPRDRAGFAFPALTYFPERARTRIAYLSIFPIGERMRANLFCYRDADDPWLAALQATPEAALFAELPGLRRLTGAVDIVGPVRIRPVDLVRTTGLARPGLVVIGDAFGTSCPAAGTGCNKVFTDVKQLCGVHVPQWLASPGMGADKIAAFYADPVKQACDADSVSRAVRLRTLSTAPGLPWRARRVGKFVGHLGVGYLRRLSERLPSRGETRASA